MNILEIKLKIENKTRQKIKSFLAMNGYTLKEVVEKMNELHPEEPTTAQNITNKLARETIKFTEVVEIAEICGYSLEFIPQKEKLYFPISEERNEEIAQITTKSKEDMIKIPSPNFGETIIYGANAQVAANQLINQPNLSKSAEILLHQKLKQDLDVIISVTNNHTN